ncbi:hypothetical protein BCR41DRAFT_402330 [Lobosporangium transversale]|uniref:Uncharacterized protein n=1 Tax=Lobosporangium transversale TaxID=64571 RepID=A0A1Y2G9I6_9FUNG|nr:hypothetical protein BCR41DRAFT_402330 [Lobosporangium transversale]ORY95168.1 hypothetical protein BCR41DRAFT_402330 [Lobosporangium transversale]|eukprot:XP_021875375.1 hypothetical protein BCR41DRAFT_402330 [Lobosporangium transversale]
MVGIEALLRNTKATEPFHIIEPFVRLFEINDTEEILNVISAALTELLDVNYDASNDRELSQQCERYTRWKQAVETSGLKSLGVGERPGFQSFKARLVEARDKTFRTSCTKFFAKKTAAATSTPATTASTFRRSDRIKGIRPSELTSKLKNTTNNVTPISFIDAGICELTNTSVLTQMIYSVSKPKPRVKTIHAFTGEKFLKDKKVNSREMYVQKKQKMLRPLIQDVCPSA